MSFCRNSLAWNLISYSVYLGAFMCLVYIFSPKECCLLGHVACTCFLFCMRGEKHCWIFILFFFYFSLEFVFYLPFHFRIWAIMTLHSFLLFVTLSRVYLLLYFLSFVLLTRCSNFICPSYFQYVIVIRFDVPE